MPLRDMEISLVNFNFALSAMDNVLTQTMTTHYMSLDDGHVMFEDDHHGVSRQPWGGTWVCVLGISGLHLWEALLGAGCGPVFQLGSGGL